MTFSEHSLSRCNASRGWSLCSLNTRCRYPPFSSQHEGYAVILEEIEEARAQINALEQRLGHAWDIIKHDSNAKELIGMCKHSAVWAACELIQVAAMCQKFQALGGKK